MILHRTRLDGAISPMKSILFLGPFSLFFPLENGREREESRRERRSQTKLGGAAVGREGGREGIHRGSIFSRVRGREAEKKGRMR